MHFRNAMNKLILSHTLVILWITRFMLFWIKAMICLLKKHFVKGNWYEERKCVFCLLLHYGVKVRVWELFELQMHPAAFDASNGLIWNKWLSFTSFPRSNSIMFVTQPGAFSSRRNSHFPHFPVDLGHFPGSSSVSNISQFVLEGDSADTSLPQCLETKDTPADSEIDSWTEIPLTPS